MTINPAEHQEQQEELTGPEAPYIDPADHNVDYICPHCGSRDIALVATAIWNANGQYYELRGIDGPYTCDDCGEDFDKAKVIDLDAVDYPELAAVEPAPVSARDLLTAAQAVIDCLDNGGGFSDDERLWNESCNMLRAAIKPATPAPAKPYTVFMVDHQAIQTGIGSFGVTAQVTAAGPEAAAEQARADHARPEDELDEMIETDLTVAAVIAGHHATLYDDVLNG